ncbi:MAG: hypothetical protein WCS52_15120 [bacterium]
MDHQIKTLSPEDQQHLINQLEAIKTLPKHSSHKSNAMKDVIAWMVEKKFDCFTTNVTKNGEMYRGKVGDYFLGIPPKGNRRYSADDGPVIVVCVGTGIYCKRHFMAGHCA